MTPGSLVLLEGPRLAGAVALSDAAGWNHTAHDWRRLAALEPEGSRSLARANGFEPVRRLVRMVRPGGPAAAKLASRVDLVYAGAGFEYG